MNEVKDDLTSLKECLTSLNETMIQLSGDLEEHKNWTKSELADLQTFVNKYARKELRSVKRQLSAKLGNLDSKLVLVGDHMNEEFRSVEE